MVEVTRPASNFQSQILESIAPEDIARLFQPFSRAKTGSIQRGLGLGLYIASEIARAHGGSLGVSSSADETRFTFRMAASESGKAAGDCSDCAVALESLWTAEDAIRLSDGRSRWLLIANILRN